MKHYLQSKSFLLLVAIFLLALFLRIYHLSSVPVELHHDELINGYVGKFILQNGKDLYGNRWPIFYFDKFGDYPPVLPMYLSGMGIIVFGTNEFGLRFPTALFGALTVFAVYLLGRILFPARNIALLAAFFLAILPWHVVLSRYSAEGIFGLSVFSFALSFLLFGAFRRNFKIISIAFVLFLISYLLYPSFRLLTPLVLVPLPFMFWKEKIKYVFVVFLLLSLLATLAIGTTKWGSARFKQTALIYSPGVIHTITAFHNDEGASNIGTARVFHNKVVGYSQEFIRQYVSYFSSEFLFTKGGLNHTYVIPDKGLLFVLFIPLFVGLLLPRKGNKENFFTYNLYLFAIAPIPAALTTDFTPNLGRAIFMTIPLVYMASYGAYVLHKTLSQKNNILSKSFFVAIASLFILEFIYFAHQYMQHTASYKSFFTDQGNKQLATFLLESKNKYNEIISLHGTALPLYYLYFKNDFRNIYAGKFYQGERMDGFVIDKIDNIEFIPEQCPTKPIKARQLFIWYGDCDMPFLGVKELMTIYRSDSTRAFRLFESIDSVQ